MDRIRSHLTYANVMATLAVFIALGGTAAAAFVVSNNSQVGPGTISGHKPPSGKHANVIPGSVNGQDVADNSLKGADINESRLTGDARKLTYDTSPSAAVTKIATVGGYTLKGQCGADVTSVVFRLSVNGPAGGANIMYAQTVDDTTDRGNFSRRVQILAGTNTGLLQFEANPGHFERQGGTVMLRSGGVLVQVDFDAVADARSPGNCFLRGTATRAT